MKYNEWKAQASLNDVGTKGDENSDLKSESMSTYYTSLNTRLPGYFQMRIFFILS